jgi:hypothetical protein
LKSADKTPTFSKSAAVSNLPPEGKCLMNVWLIKPEGLYDTYEPADFMDEWEEEESEPWELKLGTYNGWRFRSVR